MATKIKFQKYLPVQLLFVLLVAMLLLRATPEFDRYVRRDCTPIEYELKQSEYLESKEIDLNAMLNWDKCSKPTVKSRFYDFVNALAAAGLSIMLAKIYLDKQSDKSSG